MSEQFNHENMTPVQLSMPKTVQLEAYRRLHMTCDEVRLILAEAQDELMRDLEIPDYDSPIVDAAMSRAFQKIRDEVTQPFRDEQMRLLHKLERMKNDPEVQNILDEIEDFQSEDYLIRHPELATALIDAANQPPSKIKGKSLPSRKEKHESH